MGCTQTKSNQTMSMRIIQMQTRSAILINNQQSNTSAMFNISKNPIMKRREEKKLKTSLSNACTPTTRL